MTATVLAGLGCWTIAERRDAVRPWLAAVIGGGVVAFPLAGIAATTVWLARTRWRRARTRRDATTAATADVSVLADLLVLGLTAGLSLRASLDAAAPHLHPMLRVDVDALTVRVDRMGMAAGLSGVMGRLEGLARVVAGAAVSGAPLGSALAAFARTRRHEEHTQRVAAARRLPVRLLMPLALLILPGFVVLTVGPAVLEGLARLGPIP